MRDLAKSRSWLFVSSIDQDAFDAALGASPDVVMIEFEDFTPPGRRPEGRARLSGMVWALRQAGIHPAARINPLHTEDGPDDLKAVLEAGIRVIAFPKTRGPDDVAAVAAAIDTFDARKGGAAPYSLVPNVETAAALRQTFEIATAHDAVLGCLVASEDMAADLGAERTRDGAALRYVRERFLIDCVAAGVRAIDCPYTWGDTEGLITETAYAKTLGYKAKSAVAASHIAPIHETLGPSDKDLAEARRIVACFEGARAEGRDRAMLDGHALEVPTYRNALAILEREGIL